MTVNLSQNVSLIVAASAAVFIIFLLFRIWRIEHRLKRLLQGKTVSLEEVVTENHKKVKEIEQHSRALEGAINNIEQRLQKSIRSIKTVRFNPFKGTGDGGNQSFSSAFINEQGTGIVLTGLYHRERISLFAKPIKNLNSEFELSAEEKQALEEARIDIKQN